MAVAAETLAVELVPDWDVDKTFESIVGFNFDTGPKPGVLQITEGYQFVDSIPEVAELRQRERLGAWAVLNSRRSQDGGREALTPPVDALSTAHSVINAARTYGANSEQFNTLRNGLQLDCQRLVAEWYRKNKAEYFPALCHTFDAQKQEFYSHGLSVTQMTHNALLPVANRPEEEVRRVNEKVEDATPLILSRVLGRGALSGVKIRTFSECPEWARDEYEQDMAAKRKYDGYLGYVPDIDKTMVRDQWIDPVTGDRMQVQISLSGKLITPEVKREALRRSGLDISDDISRTELHGMQILAADDVMDVAKTMDEVARDYWCNPNIFMGEEVPAGHPKDYQDFIKESESRQDSLKSEAELVTSFVLDLATDDVDRNKALVMVEEFVKSVMLDLAKADINEAGAMFGQKTVEGLARVIALENSGDHEAAALLREEVFENAEGGGFCGGGCGIEEVNTKTVAGAELAKKLGALPGEKVVKDKVRRCKCGGGVAYAYSKEHVRKLCTGCGRSESKRSLVSSSIES